MRQLKITKSITSRESASLDKYLQEVNKEELVTAEEEVELAQKIKKWDLEALQKLARANLRFVVSVAKQYQNQWLSLPDLINEGNIGLMKAAERFDEQRGFKFISYAVRWIRQGILQALAEHSRTVRLPLNQVGKLGKVNKASAIFEQEFERPPANRELAEILDMSERHMKEVSANNTRTLSLDSPFTEGDQHSEEGNLLDVLESDEFSSPDNGLYIESLKTEIARVLDTLTPRERDILKLFHWMDQDHERSLEEIAEQFGLTRERVRQIKEKAIRRLRHTSRSRHLKWYLGQWD